MYKITLTAIAIISSIVIVASPFINTNNAKAISGSDFKAGRIIDDFIFTNKDTMSVAQIQQFLNAKVPTCDIWHSAYNASNPPPYTCLKDYQENPTNGDNNFGRYVGSTPYQVPGGKSAAQIIWEASQAYIINPQVLIVLLQKEQGLVTDTWPLRSQFTKAMGYLCPDTAPCSASAGGFYKQVFGAAWQFRHDFNGIDTPNYWSPYGKGWNNIYYNPSTSCGTRSVLIETQATAVLYKYTPYTPNDAALVVMNDNTAGGTVPCGAYGNRNFFWYFTKWFGSTLNQDYSWDLIAQLAYKDNTKTSGSSLQNMLPGEKAYISIIVKNTGNRTWSNNGQNPTRMGAIRPYERLSSFCDSTWLSCSRPTVLKEASVAPGEIGTFEFWITAPLKGGLFKEYFNPLVESDQWMNDMGMYFSISTQSPVTTWQLINQAAYTDSSKTVGRGLANMTPGEKAFVELKAKNTGNMTWKNSGVNATYLGTENPKDRLSLFAGTGATGWYTQNRPTVLKEASVAPGEIGTFEFWITAPDASGIYIERMNLVTNGVAWMNDIGLSYYIKVESPISKWRLINQAAYTDSSKTVGRGLANMTPGEKAFVELKAKNTGNMTWKNSGVNATYLGTENPKDRLSLFAGTGATGWYTQNRPTVLKEASVAPGEIGTFEFWITAPDASGIYIERMNLVTNGVAWMNDIGLSYYIKVN